MAKDTFYCEDCGKKFTRISNSLRDCRTSHNVESFCCSSCARCLNRRDNHQPHTSKHVQYSHQGSHKRNDSELLTISQNTENENACSNIQNQIRSGGSFKSYQGKKLNHRYLKKILNQD